MKYVFDHMTAMEASMADRHVLLLVDFDGTLSPIAPTPDEATLPDETRRELARIASASMCSCAVVSGRTLESVRAKVGLPGIVYVGNHGLEIARPNEAPKRAIPAPEYPFLTAIKGELEERLAPFAGVIVEDKGYGLAVHYRMVAASERRLVRDAVERVAQERASGGAMAVSTGAMVVELRPSHARDKGTVVSELISEEAAARGADKTFALYLGDDATDEDAFRAIKGRGWGILVGAPRMSYAEYYLNGPDEVRRLLGAIAERCERRM